MSLGGLYKLAKQRVFLRRVVELQMLKNAQLAQFSPTPLSSKTAIADYIANKKYKPEPNPLTTGINSEQETLDKLLAGMSRSRARVVGARRKARGDVRSLLAKSKLWG